MIKKVIAIISFISLLITILPIGNKLNVGAEAKIQTYSNSITNKVTNEKQGPSQNEVILDIETNDNINQIIVEIEKT